MKELLSLLKSFPDQFNESTMFPGGKAASIELRKQFQVGCMIYFYLSL